jgi:hypothetical protein
MREERKHVNDQNSLQEDRTERSASSLNDMSHLNQLLREKTRENLFLGTWNYD